MISHTFSYVNNMKPNIFQLPCQCPDSVVSNELLPLPISATFAARTSSRLLRNSFSLLLYAYICTYVH